MKIQELIDELSKIRDTKPDADVVIEVFDIKNSTILKGWMFDITIKNASKMTAALSFNAKTLSLDKEILQSNVRIRQKRCIGYCLYEGYHTEDLKELEKSLCPTEKREVQIRKQPVQ